MSHSMLSLARSKPRSTGAFASVLLATGMLGWTAVDETLQSRALAKQDPIAVLTGKDLDKYNLGSSMRIEVRSEPCRKIAALSLTSDQVNSLVTDCISRPSANSFMFSDRYSLLGSERLSANDIANQLEVDYPNLKVTGSFPLEVHSPKFNGVAWSTGAAPAAIVFTVSDS